MLMLDRASVQIYKEANSPSAIPYNAVNIIINTDGKVYIRISFVLWIVINGFLCLPRFFIFKSMYKIYQHMYLFMIKTQQFFTWIFFA